MTFGGCNAMCVNTVESEMPSPDRSSRAVVFYRGCGATTSGSIQVSLLGADEPLPNEPGNAFALRHEGPVSISWAGDTLLVAHSVGASIDFKAQQVGGVKVKVIEVAPVLKDSAGSRL
jgi:hypothetical protein